MEQKKEYEAPCLEVVEYKLEDSIAMSSDLGPTLGCGEWFGGGES